MAEITKPTTACVAGFVKGPIENRDGSVTFKVAGKYGQRFVLASKSEFAEMLRDARRALVRFEVLRKNPRILLIIPNPSDRLIRQYMEGDS
jgi:hypothetical protein